MISDLLHRRRPEFLILTIEAQTTKTNGPVDRTDKNGDFKKGGERGQGANEAPYCRWDPLPPREGSGNPVLH